MFEKAKARKSMSDLGAWFDANAIRLHPFSMRDALPAPMLIFGDAQPNLVFITVKDSNYMLCLDDDSQSSAIPTWQHLGEIGTPPAQVVARTISTLDWFIAEAKRTGHVKREVAFSWNLQQLGRVLRLQDVEGRGMIPRLRHLIDEQPDNPTTFNGHLETARRLENPRAEALISFEQGRATERAIANGDTRFDRSNALYYYDKAISIADSSTDEGIEEISAAAKKQVWLLRL